MAEELTSATPRKNHMSLYSTRKRTDFIVVHCTATPEGKPFTAKDVDRWHREKGWNGIGYHFVVLLDGNIEAGRPANAVGAHVEGYNSNSIGVVYVGGVDAKGKSKDTRTPAQKRALELLVKDLVERYPGATVQGHRDFPGVKKDCPCFDTKKWWASVPKQAPYTVAEGDTLYAISRRLGTTVDALAKANGINPNLPIQPGQVLRRPA